MKTYDVLMLLAVLISPFLAVFAQKRIEEWRARKGTQLWIFKTLMATRAATLSPNHVQALNMIDLEFSGRSEAEKEVRRLWREYLDHLGSLPQNPEEQRAALPTWKAKSGDYLTDLLSAMGTVCGYQFDKVHIRKAIYSPEGHAQDEMEARLLRILLLEILNGKRRFPIGAVLELKDESEEKFAKAYRKGMLDVLQGKSGLVVKVTPPFEKEEEGKPNPQGQ